MQAGPSSHTISFTLQSSDVLEDARINVLDTATKQVVWYQERFLGDDEIIEHVVHNATSTILWKIHRPKRGWYIRLQSPTFPPNVFIPITPVPHSAPHFVEAALEFRSRTNVVPSVPPEPSVHVYPPTPPAGPSLTIQPPSPTETTTDVTDARSRHRTLKSIPLLSPQISHFVLSPHSSTQPNEAAPTSLFGRALAMLRSSRPSSSFSFSLARLGNSPMPPPPYAPATDSTSHLPSYSSPTSSPPISSATPLPVSSSPSPATSVPAPTSSLPPFLTFHDRTPLLTLGSLSGELVIDAVEAQSLGVDTSFWIAVALAYLEFLSDRESYLAAVSD